MLLTPDVLNAMAGDFDRLINGPDGADVILHWTQGSGAQDVYGRQVSEIEVTAAQRAHVSPVTNHNVSVRAVQRQRVADLQTGDVVFLFPASLDMSPMTGLWIEVPGMGNFTPEAKPTVNEAHAHAVLFPSGNKFVQEIYARVKR